MASAVCDAVFELRTARAAWRCEPLNHEDTVSVFPEWMASKSLSLVLPVEAGAPWSPAMSDRADPLGLWFNVVKEAF